MEGEINTDYSAGSEGFVSFVGGGGNAPVASRYFWVCRTGGGRTDKVMGEFTSRKSRLWYFRHFCNLLVPRVPLYEQSSLRLNGGSEKQKKGRTQQSALANLSFRVLFITSHNEFISRGCKCGTMRPSEITTQNNNSAPFHFTVVKI